MNNTKRIEETLLAEQEGACLQEEELTDEY